MDEQTKNKLIDIFKELGELRGKIQDVLNDDLEKKEKEWQDSLTDEDIKNL